MNIPQGYKSSPLGIIPKDWEVKRLGEIGIFVKGYGVPKDHIKKDGYPCLTYGDLYTKYDVVIKNIQSFIDDEDAATSQKIYDGDILFAGSGETPEDIGKCAAYIDKQVAYAGGDIIILRPTMSYNSLVLSYILNSDIGGKQRYKMAQGHSVVHIYPCNLEKISIPLPPLAEQERIAELLGTWDKAIEMQKQLIDKLELRKKGLMQQLLTGKKRLPGFTGEWKKKQLENIEKEGDLQLYRGKVISKIDIQNHPGDYPIYSSSIIDAGLMGKYGEYMFDEELISWSIDGGGHFFYRPKHKFSITNVSGYIRLNTDKLNYRFMAYLLHFEHRKKVFDYQKKAHPSVIRKEYILLLPPLAEQTAIANVLSSMDDEIQKLIEKRDKYIEEKQGLMQVLLTGKKRI